MTYSNLYARLYATWQIFVSGLVAVWRFPASRLYLLGFLLLQFLAWWQSLFIFQHLSSRILVLHYNVDLGIDLVGNPKRIFIYPLYALGILFLNLIIAALLHRQRNFHTFIHLLLAAALIFALFLSLALFFIYLINFR